MRCIICRKEEIKGTDEHIIPDSLGGKLYYNNVCKKCNSLLGDKIDNYLTNSILVAFNRDRYNISGKKKKNFSWYDIMKFKTENGKKIKVRKDENKKLKYEIIEKIEENGKITFIGESREKLYKMTKECLERLGMNINEVEIREETIEKKIVLIGEKKENIYKIDLALLKICFEFLMSKEEKYIEDEKGKKISKLFYDYIQIKKSETSFEKEEKVFTEIRKEVCGGIFFSKRKEIIEYIKYLIKPKLEKETVENNHIVAIIYTGTETFVAVLLFFEIWGLYKLSNDSFGKSGCIIVRNDFVNKKVSTYNFLI